MANPSLAPRNITVACGRMEVDCRVAWRTQSNVIDFEIPVLMRASLRTVARVFSH